MQIYSFCFLTPIYFKKKSPRLRNLCFFVFLSFVLFIFFLIFAIADTYIFVEYNILITDMNNSNHVVVMAGGIGSRFWPMSTTERPKQFIDVLGCGKSLLQLTVERFGDICPITCSRRRSSIGSVISFIMPSFPSFQTYKALS